MAISAVQPAAAASYEVKHNDTLFKIAQTRFLGLSALLSANKGIDPLNLQVGQVIHLPTTPEAKTEEPKPAVPTKKAAVPTASKKPAQQPLVATSTGQKLAYKQKLNAVATAYTAHPAENGGWGGVDYFGNPLKVGTIAVDPDVIPLGTKVYITGYNAPALPGQGLIAKATDVGGSIKGNKVDIFLPSSAEKFGMQNVQIYILK